MTVNTKYGVVTALAVASLVLSTLTVGCSALLDFDECQTDADCTSVPGVAVVCSAEHYCVEASLPNTTMPSNTGTSNTSTAGTSNTTPCCTWDSCQATNVNSVCVECACVEVENSNCAIKAGSLTEDALLIGSILPVRGDASSIGIPIEQAIELAVTEINTNGGLGDGRRAVLIGCDSSGSVDVGKASAQHLVDVGVPAIVGPAFSSIFIEVSDLISSKSNVMLISPSATSPAISTLDDDGLSWRTVASDIFQAGALARRVEDRIVAQEIIDPKVLAFGKNDAYGTGLLGKVSDALSDTISEDFLVARIYPDPGEVMEIDYNTIIQDALDEFGSFSPDFVLLLGTNEIVQIMELLEASITMDRAPFYILSDGGRVVETLDYVSTNDAVIQRIEGVVADGKNDSLWTSYNRRFKTSFGSEEAGIYSANAYDAAYVIAFGAMTLIAEEAEFSGVGLSNAMIKLITGMPVEVGPDSVGAARNILLNGGNIDFNGASGPVQFDTVTGDVASNVILWTITTNSVSGEYEFVDTELFSVDINSWGPLNP